MSKHHRRLIAVASAAFGSLLFACSSPSQETPVATTTAAQPPAPSAAAGAVAGPAAFQGSHDAATCEVITGWVWDRNRPDVPLSVQISDESTTLATVAADILRPDLVKAGMGNGQHSFRYVVPDSLKDGQPHTIRVLESVANFRLAGTPKQLTCP